VAAFVTRETTYVANFQTAQDMADFAQQRPLAHIGFAFEYRYDRPGVVIDQDHIAYDPRSIRPLLLALSLAQAEGDAGGSLFNFVIDLWRPEVYPAVGEALRLPVRFVGHFLQAEFYSLFQLALPEPRNLWDSWVHERARYLGRYHPRYRLSSGGDEAEQARVKAEIEEDDTFRYSLPATCQRYGVPYVLAGQKPRLQESFLHHPEGADFTDTQIRYAAEDAVAVARLYPLQVSAAAQAGILLHLDTIEMPWTRTNARISWHGLRIDPQGRGQVLEACQRHLPGLESQLAAYGVTNICSQTQIKAFLAKVGLLELFRRHGKYSFDKDQLRRFQDRHPALPLLRAARRAHDLQAEKILAPEMVGADGRLHPEHRQLGAHTGRQTSRWPNVLRLGRVLRPLIVPDRGRGIGDVDWAQIEVGLAGAVYRDPELVAMFNTGDVYAAMAQHFYRHQLSEVDLALPGLEFKRRHPALRARMKSCTLGIIYGLTPRGLALDLNIPEAEAEALQRQFLGMFPKLQAALAREAAFGTLRGYASTVTGLHRHRAGQGPASPWERNWLVNHPVQASAAVLLKDAGNRLDKLYRQYNAWLIVPFHDAFVFEAPLAVLSEVATLTGQVMCQTVQEHFPELRPRVEVNLSHPECWNKEGHADALARWLEDPTYSI
jgi:DNA polymerase-1